MGTALALAEAEAAAKLERSGVRLTLQRQSILEHLYNRLSHPSAEQLYLSIFRSSPQDVSRTTVYNTLRTLKRLGLVTEFTLRQDAYSRYDVNVKPHHHLVCDSCGSITDVELDLPSALKATSTMNRAYRIHGGYAELSGQCPACADEQPHGIRPKAFGPIKRAERANGAC